MVPPLETMEAKKNSEDDAKNNFELDIYTWNVERKGNPEEIDCAIVKTLNKIPNIVCLQEANLPVSSGETKNFWWLFSGDTGSAILVSKVASLETSNVIHVCEQICTAEVRNSQGISLRVISCYIPPSTEFVSADLWDKLTDLIKVIPSNVKFVLAGDFNAQVGSTDLSNADKSLFRRSLYHETCDENGVKLKKLARSTWMKALFCGSGSKTEFFTYRIKDVQSQRDYIFIPHCRDILGSSVVNNWHPDYKHTLLGTRFIILDPRRLDEGELSSEPRITVSTWNTQGAAVDKLDSVLSEQNLPIVCVQELFLTSEEDIETDNFNWYHSKKAWAKNVGIAIKKSPDITLTDFKVLSECLCVGDVVFQNRAVIVISCYLPLPSDPRNATVQAQLEDLLKSIPEDKFLVLGGDFNTDLSRVDLRQHGDFDENTIFLCKLADDTKLCMKSSLWKQYSRRRNLFITRLTDKDKSMPHHILIPYKIRQSSFVRMFVKRIPFYSNAIFSLILTKGCDPAFQMNFRKAKYTPHKHLEETSSVFKRIRTEVVNGVAHEVRVFDFEITHSDEDEPLEKPFPVSVDDVEKFSNKPPSAQELGRILKDFVLIYPTNTMSLCVTSALHVLDRSFITGKFGSFENEVIEGQDGSVRKKKRSCKITWNGILLAEKVGDLLKKPNQLRKAAAFDIIAKLSQTCPTIKCKRSYYNKGVIPMLMHDPRISEALKKVDRKSVPTMPDVKKHIDEFFSQDTDLELVFGPEFNKKELVEIRKHAHDSKLGYRLFASTLGQKEMDHIALFKKRSPQYIRDKLLQQPDHLKYFLIPPCGLGKDYFSFQRNFEAEHQKGEAKLIQAWTQLHLLSKSPVEKDLLSTRKNNIKDVRKLHPQQNTKVPPRNKSQSTGQKFQNRNELRNNQNRGTKRPLLEARFSRAGQHQDKSAPPGKRVRMGDSRPTRERRRVQESAEPHRPIGQSMTTRLPRTDVPNWYTLAPLVVIWPVNIRSEEETVYKKVLEANFPTQFQRRPDNKVAAIVKLPMRSYPHEKAFCLSIASDEFQAGYLALQEIKKHSTIIKPNPGFLCKGGVPNFIRYKVPCQTTPRTYLILSYNETGPLTEHSVKEIFETFAVSFNEDIYFDRHGYTLEEKLKLLELAPKFDFIVRHFGDAPGLVERYVCVSKKKTKMEIVEEVLKMRNFHPKYIMERDKLPPSLSLSIF